MIWFSHNKSFHFLPNQVPKSPQAKTGAGGFTLIELVATIVITAIIAGAVSHFLLFSWNTYGFVDSRKRTLHEARLALQIMNREFRQIQNVDGVSVATSSELKFIDYDGNVNDFLYSNNAIKKNGYKLADNVTAFQFRYLKTNGQHLGTPVPPDSLSYIWNIEANYTIQISDQSVPFHLLVHPRNF